MSEAGATRVVAVAYSGGRDSSALLHATQAAAPALGIDVRALHVNHRLSEFADEWEAHCRRHCDQAGIAFAAVRLTTQPAPGDSVEAWARTARHHALRQLAAATGAALVLLAHHRRDQAETLLLQALRGGGVAGLAGMPRQVLRDGIVWARPWLGVSREAIDAYLARHSIVHVDDDSNADRRFARNRLRLDVWPALTAAFPHAEAALATSAGWAQQAAAGLEELAGDDLARLDAASADGERALPLGEWQRLSPARRCNALRAWLRRATGQSAPATLIERLLDELPSHGSASWACGGGRLLRRYRGLLRLARDSGLTTADAASASTATQARRRSAAPGAADGDVRARTAASVAADKPGGACATVPTAAEKFGGERSAAALAAERPCSARTAAPSASEPSTADNTAMAHAGARIAGPNAGGPVPAADRAVAHAASRPVAVLSIRRAGRYRVPGWPACCLRAERVGEGGVPLAWLARLEVRRREGGERFQAAVGRPPRSLKKQFQAAGRPAWEREAPLLFSGGQLVFVPGLGTDARATALPGQPQLRLHWVVDATSPAATPPPPAAQPTDRTPPAKIEG